MKLIKLTQAEHAVRTCTKVIYNAVNKWSLLLVILFTQRQSIHLVEVVDDMPTVSRMAQCIIKARMQIVDITFWQQALTMMLNQTYTAPLLAAWCTAVCPSESTAFTFALQSASAWTQYRLPLCRYTHNRET